MGSLGQRLWHRHPRRRPRGLQVYQLGESAEHHANLFRAAAGAQGLDSAGEDPARRLWPHASRVAGEYRRCSAVARCVCECRSPCLHQHEISCCQIACSLRLLRTAGSTCMCADCSECPMQPQEQKPAGSQYQPSRSSLSCEGRLQEGQNFVNQESKSLPGEATSTCTFVLSGMKPNIGCGH